MRGCICGGIPAVYRLSQDDNKTITAIKSVNDVYGLKGRGFMKINFKETVEKVYWKDSIQKDGIWIKLTGAAATVRRNQRKAGFLERGV